jgi:prevent-host-death family protein
MAAINHRSRGARGFVGASSAKKNLSELLERVARGEEITITKHSRPVARLVPFKRRSREDVVAVFRQIDELRESLRRSSDKTSLKKLINRGRRF